MTGLLHAAVASADVAALLTKMVSSIIKHFFWYTCKSILFRDMRQGNQNADH